MSLKAILETSLYVSDVERAVAFYQDVLGLRRIDDGYFAGGRGAALHVGSGPSVADGQSPSILMSTPPGHGPQHGPRSGNSSINAGSAGALLWYRLSGLSEVSIRPAGQRRTARPTLGGETRARKLRFQNITWMRQEHFSRYDRKPSFGFGVAGCCF